MFNRSISARKKAPDLLLNNAGVINYNAHLWEINAQEFSDVIDVNIKDVANIFRNFVPAMAARRVGVRGAASAGHQGCAVQAVNEFTVIAPVRCFAFEKLVRSDSNPHAGH